MQVSLTLVGGATEVRPVSSTVHDVLDHEEIVRLYGPWLPRTPRDAAALLEGYADLWWIAGGWAIEAFTDIPRVHDDVDPSIPRSGVASLHQHLSGRLDVWQADEGSLRPIVEPTDPVSATCENLWLRPSGAHPWEYDVILMNATPTTWTYKRHPGISLPLSKLLWARDGVRYLRPEVQLLHKAPGLRAKDQADFDACAPLLDHESRAWLRDALCTAHPGHPWLSDLQ